MALRGLQTGAREGWITTSIWTAAEAPPHGFYSRFISRGTAAEAPPYGFYRGLALSRDIVRINLPAVCSLAVRKRLEILRFWLKLGSSDHGAAREEPLDTGAIMRR